MSVKPSNCIGPSVAIDCILWETEELFCAFGKSSATCGTLFKHVQIDAEAFGNRWWLQCLLVQFGTRLILEIHFGNCRMDHVLLTWLSCQHAFLCSFCWPFFLSKAWCGEVFTKFKSSEEHLDPSKVRTASKSGGASYHRWIPRRGESEVWGDDLLEKLWSFSYRFRLLVSTFVSVFQEYLAFWGLRLWVKACLKPWWGFALRLPLLTVETGLEMHFLLGIYTKSHPGIRR